MDISLFKFSLLKIKSFILGAVAKGILKELDPLVMGTTHALQTGERVIKNINECKILRVHN